MKAEEWTLEKVKEHKNHWWLAFLKTHSIFDVDKIESRFNWLTHQAEKLDELNTPKGVKVGRTETIRYGDSEDCGCSTPLNCPVCGAWVGEYNDCDEYNFHSNRCGECGQTIQQVYTDEEVEEWIKQQEGTVE